MDQNRRQLPDELRELGRVARQVQAVEVGQVQELGAAIRDVNLEVAGRSICSSTTLRPSARACATMSSMCRWMPPPQLCVTYSSARPAKCRASRARSSRARPRRPGSAWTNWPTRAG